jgi:hypothetical protein
VKMIAGLLFSLFLASCAAVETTSSDIPSEVTGTYQYIDGDRLVYPCSGPERCMYTLVRDERLSQNAASLVGSTLTLRVRRVDACGPQSSEVACYRSLDRTALIILEWLNVRRP